DYLQQANLILYNTSANLADCWGDDFIREPRHFEKGLEYARKALWYREHLGKAAANKAMAWWAIGKHLMSLGHLEESRDAFATSFDYEVKAAGEAGKPAEVG